MKKIHPFSILCLLAPLFLASCGGRSSSGGGSSTPTQDPTFDPSDDTQIQVKFYLDYNKINLDEIYATKVIKRGSKVSEPTKPTEAPSSDFPVFLGWSAKEIIDDKKDLWNFSTKITTDENVFNLFGIWVAEGEN